MRAEEEHAFSIPAAQMENFIHQERADALVFSNPCNPTGELISGDTLERYVAAARRENCLLGILTISMRKTALLRTAPFPPPNLWKTWTGTRSSFSTA